MKQTGLMFKSDMVRAILDGRKRQTRRLVKVRPEPPRAVYGLPQSDTTIAPRFFNAMTRSGSLNTFVGWDWSMTKLGSVDAVYSDSTKLTEGSPCGGVGDLIWVRETFASPLVNPVLEDGVVYRATDPDWSSVDDFKWTPSIHMPKWASRLWLEITNYRVEKVSAITEEDAIAEGFNPHSTEGCGVDDWWCHGTCNRHGRCMYLSTVRHSFEKFWVATYGQESWDNGWCWVYDFKLTERPE